MATKGRPPFSKGGIVWEDEGIVTTVLHFAATTWLLAILTGYLV